VVEKLFDNAYARQRVRGRRQYLFRPQHCAVIHHWPVSVEQDTMGGDARITPSL
jgi:hypothetical protein